MITTQRDRIPWWWTGVLAVPSGAESLIEAISGAALTYSLWKFTQDPALIAFLGSINLIFNFLIAPVVAWQSDRIWTRFGRRKPFMLVGWLIVALLLLAIPLAPSLVILIAIIVLFHAAVDFGFTGPWTPLYFEIVPPAQRGRAIVIKRFGMIGAQLIFNLLLIGQFDRKYRLGIAGSSQAVFITGEQVIYAVGSIVTIGAWIMIAMLVREQKPAYPNIERFHPRRFVQTLFGTRKRWALYLLAFSSVAMTACLGQLQPLLITQQFGYSKQILGNMFAIVMAAEIFITLPIMAFLADRVSKIRLYQITIGFSAVMPMAFWLYIKLVAPGQIPPAGMIVAFMVCHTLIRTAATLCIEPIFFDCVSPEEMGTAQSGLLLVRGVLSVIVLNGVGWWVKVYSYFFPLGENMKMDFTSAYLYIAGLALVALVASVIYATRLIEVKSVDAETPPGTMVSSGAASLSAEEQLAVAASTRPALTRPELMGGPCCKMK